LRQTYFEKICSAFFYCFSDILNEAFAPAIVSPLTFLFKQRSRIPSFAECKDRRFYHPTQAFVSSFSVLSPNSLVSNLKKLKE